MKQMYIDKFSFEQIFRLMENKFMIIKILKI